MKKTLFVINDAILLSVFKSWAFRSQKKEDIFWAKNGKEALEVLRSTSIELIIFELNLSEGDGLELLANLSSEYPSLKTVISISGLASDAAKKLLGFSSLYFIEKPEGLKDFTRLVDLLDSIDFQAKPLNEMVAAEFFGLIEIHKKTCLVAIEIETPAKKGVVYFDQGVLADAVCGEIKAESAILEMLGWKPIKATFISLENKKFRKQIQTSLNALIIESRKSKEELEAEAVEKAKLAADEAKAEAEAQEKARLAAEAKAKAETQTKTKAEAQEKARLAAEAKAKAEAEKKAKAEAQEKTRLAAEAKAKAEAEKKAQLEAVEKAKMQEMTVRIKNLPLPELLKPLHDLQNYLACAVVDMTGAVLEQHNLSTFNIEAIAQQSIPLIETALYTLKNIGLGTSNHILINCVDCVLEAVWVFEDRFIIVLLLKPEAKNTSLAKISLSKISDAIHNRLH